MSSCYSGDRIARDHMHTDIITCKMEEPKQKLRLGGVTNRLRGRAYTSFNGPKPRPLILQRLQTLGLHEDFLSHIKQHSKQTNHG